MKQSPSSKQQRTGDLAADPEPTPQVIAAEETTSSHSISLAGQTQSKFESSKPVTSDAAAIKVQPNVANAMESGTS